MQHTKVNMTSEDRKEKKLIANKKWLEKNKNYNKNYYNKNQKEIKNKSKEYKENNSDKIKNISEKYYKNNKEEILLRNKKWREKNTENIKEYREQYYEDNKEKINIVKKRYKDQNPEKIKEMGRIWRENNKEKINEYRRKRLKKDPLFKLSCMIRGYINQSFKRKNHTKKSKTYKLLGCSFEELKFHIESKFEPWMSWENHGLYNGELNYGWDIDHIIPLSSVNCEEELLKLFHHINLQPLCSRINRDIKKHNY